MVKAVPAEYVRFPGEAMISFSNCCLAAAIATVRASDWLPILCDLPSTDITEIPMIPRQKIPMTDSSRVNPWIDRRWILIFAPSIVPFLDRSCGPSRSPWKTPDLHPDTFDPKIPSHRLQQVHSTSAAFVHNKFVAMNDKIDQLADLIKEFGLEKAKMSGEDWSVEFSKNAPAEGVVAMAPAAGAASPTPTSDAGKKPAADSTPASKGTPINSPMMGIFYSSPSPGSPAFVKEGDSVSVGQVVGLIEAMKVFNEIVSPIAGTVSSMPAESGALVHPGDALIYVE